MHRPAVFLLIISVALIALSGFRNAPVPNETSHLAAGLSYWNTGRFDLYSVNPPLVRLIAAAPVKLLLPATDWRDGEPNATQKEAELRPEWSAGIDLVRKNVDRAQCVFAIARWACLPFTLIGAYFCYRWARELYGRSAGVTAVVLWSLSPTVMAWSATICPDVAAAAIGLAANYFFWRWLRESTWASGVTAGVALGIAQLTKMTWIVLFALWPIVWLICRTRRRGGTATLRFREQAGQLAAILGVGIAVLNMGYGFEGSFRRLENFTFVSRTLALDESLVSGGRGGNRFAGTCLGRLPVPLPRNYVRGMDVQKHDFERGLESYLWGEWSDRGWWYYYLVCAAVKVPLGTWCLALLALLVSLRGMLSRLPRLVWDRGGCDKRDSGDRVWQDETVLLVPAVVLILFVSSQTGFSRHFRYMLPAFPLLFIWISQLAPVAIRHPRTLGVLVVGLLTWSAASSLWVYPHSMSYFNELAGGPTRGDKYLLDSNLDWGQDAFYLARWREEHPEAVPLNTLVLNSYTADLAGTLGLRDPGRRNVDWAGAPLPGWYANSVERIRDATGDYLYFLRLQPVARIGYGFRVYHITLEEANRVRNELGKPLLPADWKPTRNYRQPSEETRAFMASVATDAKIKGNSTNALHLALFQQDPADQQTLAPLVELFDQDTDFTWSAVSASQIRTGALHGYDVVVFPGGSGSAMATSLREEGRQAVRRFVNDGGGYVGICGGAFLATAKYDWSLGLVNARTLTGTVKVPGQGEAAMAARGAGTVKIEMTTLGEELFGRHPRLLDVQFSSGPVILPADLADMPPFATLAIYCTETWLHEQQRGTMVGTPAIVAAPYGQGRVILFSPHPETSKGLEGFVRTAVRAVAP